MGLQLCIPECPNGRNEAELNERMWTRSLSLRFFYELSHLLGIVFVIDVVGYLTITAHWWYLLVYVGAVFVAKGIALILRIMLSPFYGILSNKFFAEIIVQRFVGSLIILLSITVFLVRNSQAIADFSA